VLDGPLGDRLRCASPPSLGDDRLGSCVTLIFPRRRGQRDYAATAPVWDLNSNSIGLT
jgi:hypothetical protein